MAAVMGPDCQGPAPDLCPLKQRLCNKALSTRYGSFGATVFRHPVCVSDRSEAQDFADTGLSAITPAPSSPTKVSARFATPTWPATDPDAPSC